MYFVDSFNSFDWWRLFEKRSFGVSGKDWTMEMFKKLFAKKYVEQHKGKLDKKSVTTDKENVGKTVPKNSRPIQHHQTLPSCDSDPVLKTAVEIDKSNLENRSNLMTAVDASKSTPTTSSISPYKRSVSPDTMLQGATSHASISPRCSQQSVSLSDYSSDLSFFGMKSMITTRTSSNTLVQYWWDLTPQNIHTIVINYLYDRDNKRCNKCWTFLERKLGISRLVVFYLLIGAYFLYILNGDLAKLLYYTMGIGYPMYKTYVTYESRGLNACKSWLRYWIVFGWLALLDVFFHHYLKYWTVYWSIKIIITIYLLMPLVKGADLIYRDFIKNFNKTIEQSIQLIVGK